MTPSPEDVERMIAVVELAGDIRWRELAEGSVFTIIDRQLLGEMHQQARSSGVLAALSAIGGGEVTVNQGDGRMATPPGSSSLRSPEPVPVSAHSGDDPLRAANPISTAGQLRGFLAEVLTGIRDGSVGVDKAQAIAKVAAQINQSLICEVNAALQIRKMEGEHPEAGSMLLTSDLPIEAGGGTWCDQCDKRVTSKKLASCTSQFCVKVKAP